MTVSEALNKVSAVYVPGVAGYYDKVIPNPWQKAHEDLERLMLLKDDAILRAGLDRFVSNCIGLIKAFESISAPAKYVSPADAFHIGDVDRVRHWQSRKQKHCYKCETKEKLTLVSDPNDPVRTLIVCKDCKQKGAA